MSKSKQTTLSSFFFTTGTNREPQQPTHNTKPSTDNNGGTLINKKTESQKAAIKFPVTDAKQESSISINQNDVSESASKSSKVDVQQGSEQKQEKGGDKKKINTEFYLNKTKSQPNGDYIDYIHKKWWGDYEKLQRHHGFIQWLFPNSFQSRFNPYAFALTPDQIIDFRKDKQVASRYVTSYMMMLQFYGLKLASKVTGQISYCRVPRQKGPQSSAKKKFYEDRFHKTLLTSFHNHMRITRILSSLVICGFGRYARQLSKFLQKEINDGGLRELKRYRVYEREWEQFKSYKQKEEQVNVWLKQQQKKNPKL